MVTLASENRSEAANTVQPPRSPLSRLGDFLRLLTCKRRCTQEELQKRADKRYEELLALGRAVTPRKREDWYDRLLWWSEVKTKRGARVFVLAPRGPQGETEYAINMWELIAYALTKMHDAVVLEDTPFALVWVQQNDHRVWPWSAWRLSESLHARYSKNLEAIHVVHPSWTVRVLRLLLWPLASEEFWDYFYAHERIEFLDMALDMKKFRLPKDICEYDKWLDQQAQELHKQQAAKYGGPMGSGFGGMMGAGAPDEERQKLEAQMEEMKRLLKEKGYDDKQD
eukprot:TRINITY_DN100517_c0_g1_i1.p1 TRINITY_DN100517_c0_g1~~TRINITY_DN100517_c0_g1_i1.p1  ORF type:complete len:283 (-),score=70.03 TRINITY_DN100517_c0_g1_i1:65-913(-)